MSPNDSETIELWKTNELWKTKKAAFERQLATIIDPIKQVEIEVQIELCNQEIRELEGKIYPLRDTEDWKLLHEAFQNLNTKLITIKGITYNENYDGLINDLNYHWSDDCQPYVLKCTDTDLKRIIGDGRVKDEFQKEEEQQQRGEERKQWRNNLKKSAQEIDNIVNDIVVMVVNKENRKENSDEIKEEIIENIKNKIKELGGKLQASLNSNAQILSYIDDRLKVTIRELKP